MILDEPVSENQLSSSQQSRKRVLSSKERWYTPMSNYFYVRQRFGIKEADEYLDKEDYQLLKRPFPDSVTPTNPQTVRILKSTKDDYMEEFTLDDLDVIEEANENTGSHVKSLQEEIDSITEERQRIKRMRTEVAVDEKVKKFLDREDIRNLTKERTLKNQVQALAAIKSSAGLHNKVEKLEKENETLKEELILRQMDSLDTEDK